MGVTSLMTSVPSLICRVFPNLGSPVFLLLRTMLPPLVDAYVHQTLHCLSVHCEVRLPMPARITADHSCPASGHGYITQPCMWRRSPSHSLGTGPHMPAKLRHLRAAMR